LIVTSIAVAQAAGPAQTGNAGAGSRVAGVVVSKADGHPLMGARVVVRDTRDPQKFESVVTAEDGRFAFEEVPPGKYSLEGAKKGFISAFYDQHEQYSTAIVTGAGFDTENFVLKLPPDAVITGRVLDEAGEPVRHATVSLYIENRREGVERVYPGHGAQTDDLGAYEITSLLPGTYFLSVRATPWYAVHPRTDPEGSRPAGQTNSPSAADRSLDVAYPVTYYSDVTEADSATPIPIAGGERLQIDVHLNPVPALRVVFHVPGDDKHGFVSPQFEQSTFDGSTWIQNGGASMIAPGVMEITGLPAGHYNIRFPGLGGGEGAQMSGVDLSKDGEQIDATKAEPLGTVKVSVQIPGETSLPPGFSVGLGSGVRMLSGQALDEKGQAEISQVAAGRYQVFVWGGQKPYFISHIAAEGAEVVGHTVTLGAASSASLMLTVVEGSVAVHGVVKRAGKPVAGAMVVLVPKDPEGKRDLFRRDQSDQDGTFVLPNAVPGSYSVLAIEGGWDLNWSEPGVIAVYAKHARPVEVRGDKELTLPDPVEVQSR